MEYSASKDALILRLNTSSFMERGADISFLSAFPTEKEVLYAPTLHPSLYPYTLPRTPNRPLRNTYIAGCSLTRLHTPTLHPTLSTPPTLPRTPQPAPT